ncbi:MAG TPA: DALR anticodon-binding domain-containing protein [Trebonia sp.]
MISSDLRHSLARAVAAAGFDRATDPGLRPTGTPGQYAASVALSLGPDPREVARTLAATLAQERWIAAAEVTGPGYLTITVTPEALAAVAADVITAGPGCVTSDVLAGVTVPAAPGGDPLAAPTWEEARAALAARLTARLAAAAGATVAEPPGTERFRVTRPPRASSEDPPGPPAGAAARSRTWHDDGTGEPGTRSGDSEAGPDTGLAATVAFAGRDAVTFTLARAIPGKPLRVEPEIIARHVPGNPAYAVRYAHARAASGVRWAVISRGGDPPHPPLSRRAGPMAKTAIVSGPPAGTVSCGDAGVSPRGAAAPPSSPADPGEMALSDALSWLPERVATAARRGRPDEFARYLEDLASVTVDVLSSASHHPGKATTPGSDRLALARAAQTGLAAGLGLLGVGAPERM